MIRVVNERGQEVKRLIQFPQPVFVQVPHAMAVMLDGDKTDAVLMNYRNALAARNGHSVALQIMYEIDMELRHDETTIQ